MKGSGTPFKTQKISTSGKSISGPLDKQARCTELRGLLTQGRS